MRQVFISYSHVDRADVAPFVQHLFPLAERERLDVFFDRDDLRAGDVWSDKLQAALKRCDLFLLLVTPASLASQFCMNQELLIAIDRQRRGLCRVVPIVLRACDWQLKLLPDGSRECLGRYQSLPAGGRPVASCEGAARDEVWHDIVEELSQLLAEPAAVTLPQAAAGPSAVPALLPYLCDQQRPELAVRECLMQWRVQHRPLVLVLRADAVDCPDWFVNRIDERHLRKLLQRMAPGMGLQRHSGLQWPTPQLGLHDTARLEQFFLDQLIERVLGDSYGTEEEFLQRLRDESTNRLFIGGLPTAPQAFLAQSLQAFAACLGRLTKRLDKVLLAAMLWSEDPALKSAEPDPPWDSNGPEACIGVPAALGAFDMSAVVDWSLLDEVRNYAKVDRTGLEDSFRDAPPQLTMREFAAIAGPMLLRYAA
ncbi:toll/interleukin-1 receptor domain-containing protein [Variovorax robiniae]|uniref:Toll/interleukin-1 receptor domain-containing protein n=1 Tax=Variovorax robiniae TaxID=1836199 RepID=A0ABU8XI07_9BURK